MTTQRDRQQDVGDLDELVSLYENGYMEIQTVLGDSDLTSREQLDSIAAIVFDDLDEEE